MVAFQPGGSWVDAMVVVVVVVVVVIEVRDGEDIAGGRGGAGWGEY